MSRLLTSRPAIPPLLSWGMVYHLLMHHHLSKLWDGAPIRRVRAGDGVSIMPGRRLALHLMGQPRVMAGLFADRDLKDQGFLSRLLVCAPTSTAGTRFQRALAPQTEPALRRYGDRLLCILRTKPDLLEGERNSLDPHCQF
ncbi:MAG: DUF3987 domain-containing protein, partial [Candidatus Acidiferrum sp.]